MKLVLKKVVERFPRLKLDVAYSNHFLNLLFLQESISFFLVGSDKSVAISDVSGSLAIRVHFYNNYLNPK
jgi:hypothetical protein